MVLKVNSWLRAKLQEIDVAEGFGVASLSKNQNIGVYCPFHENPASSKTKSCSVSGVGLFNCKSCGAKGDVFDFYAQKFSINRKQAISALTQSAKAKEIQGTPTSVKEASYNSKRKPTQQIVDTCVANLHGRSGITRMSYLIKQRGLTLDVIKKFKLGCDEHRITIPIYDEQKRLVNIRRYLPNAQKLPKMVSFGQGFGQSRLYPAPALKAQPLDDWVILCEGEFDCLLLRAHGYDAYTRTGGVKDWHPSFTTAFRNRKVIIIFDVNDKPSKERPEGDLGQDCAMQIADELTIKGSCEVKRVVLPLPPEYVGGDVTDFFTQFNGTKEDLDNLIEVTPLWQPNLSKVDDPIPVSLWEAANAEYYYKPIEIKGVVAGKGAAPFIIPRVVSFFETSGEDHERRFHTFDAWDGSLISLLDTSTKQLQSTMRQLLLDNEIQRLQIEETLNVEELFVVPMVESATSDTNHYVLRKAYYIGHGLQTNKSYKFIGYTMPDPKTQTAIHVLVEAELIDSDVETFFIDEEIHQQLASTFQTTNPQAKLLDIANDHALHSTHIYERPDLHIAVDLTYHSVVSFRLDNVLMKKGWLELLVVGDTRTGKGFVADGIKEVYHAGELVSGENLTMAGLIGGVQHLGGRWALTWGRIPLNDKRLVIIDECGGLSTHDIAKLSRVRSEGIAEVTKIISEKTTARTRLIWLGNPRPTTKGTSFAISDYSYGVEAIKELIGTLEDVARFDLALIVAKDEVSSEVINTAHPTEGERKYSAELCQQLLLWVWSRTAEDIHFEVKAEQLLYYFSTALAQQFSSRIPLIQGEDIRFKLARLAVAVAARTYATPDGRQLVIKSIHVETAYNFLVEIYTKPASGYAQLSEIELDRGVFKETEAIKKLFTLQRKELVVLINGLLAQRTLSSQDLCDLTGIDTFEARSIFSRLVMLQA